VASGCPTLDAQATHSLAVVLRDATARISEEEKSGVILDYDAEGRLIALEVLDASARVDGVDTVQLQVIPKARAGQPAAAERRLFMARSGCRGGGGRG
jgi:Protein of unknown function (DUF2283)